MSLWDPSYHDELLGGLWSQGQEVRQVTLMCTRATLLERIAGDGASKQWRLDHVDVCRESLASPRFAPHLTTDGMTVEAVAGQVRALFGAPRADRTGGDDGSRRSST